MSSSTRKGKCCLSPTRSRASGTTNGWRRKQTTRCHRGVDWLKIPAFQGFSLEQVTILQPKKKPRNQELSEFDKHKNSWLSSLRTRIEHAIGGVKRYRIVKDKIRNWKPGFRDAVFETCCGLHNFRLNFRPWSYGPLQLHLFIEF